jgi:hypothetical protein
MVSGHPLKTGQWANLGEGNQYLVVHIAEYGLPFSLFEVLILSLSLVVLGFELRVSGLLGRHYAI